MYISKSHYNTLAKKFTAGKQGFITKAKIIHGEKYIYDKVEYTNNKSKVNIVCTIHGDFWQRPDNHIGLKQGCPECKKIALSSLSLKDNDEFIRLSKEKHGDTFDYSKSIYKGCYKNVIITCKEHGDFSQQAQCHYVGKIGCSKCQNCGKSKKEEELKMFLQSLLDNNKLLFNSKDILKNGSELDIYIPSLNLAFEFNGLYWHSDVYKDSNYHREKTEICETQGIQLIHIYEDDWDLKKDIVKSRIKNILSKNEKKIYARKCLIKNLDNKTYKTFLNQNHLQGYSPSKIRIGLYFEDELVSLMSFSPLRISTGNKNKKNNYELLRFCNKINYTVIGGASKLFKYFLKTNEIEQIISYADRSWSQGKLYDKLGFNFTKNTKPNYFYIINKKRENRFKYRKSELIKKNYGRKEETESIILERLGYNKIYNSGNLLYTFKF